MDLRPGHTSVTNTKTAAHPSALRRSSATAQRLRSTVPPVAPYRQVFYFPEHPERVIYTKAALRTKARHGSSAGGCLNDQREDRRTPCCSALVTRREMRTPQYRASCRTLPSGVILPGA